MLTSDKTGERTAQPASYCGVVLSPPTAAGGFAFLQRTGADEVTYNVSLAGWGAGNALRSVQIQPGAPLGLGFRVAPGPPDPACGTRACMPVCRLHPRGLARALLWQGTSMLLPCCQTPGSL